MPLLPNIRSDYVHKGWWRNLTAPAYRQYLWTATNMEAVVFLGLLGILGTIAGNKLWPIIRHSLQPAVQLSDPESVRHNLSRTDAIKAFWTEIKYMKKDLTMIWTEEHGFRQKVKLSLATVSRNHHEALRPTDVNIELRFGIFALFNIVSFAILGIFIPLFLAEGLQGETIVQCNEDFPDSHIASRIKGIFNEGVLEAVTWDFKTCVSDGGIWSQTDYCVNLRNDLRPYKVEDINLTDLVPNELPYRFLREKGDTNFTALKLSQNTSLQDVAFNTEPGGTKLLHELTCIPAHLGQFIHQVNGSFNLRIKDLVPKELIPSEHSWYTIHESMILKTSNAIGSGHEIYESKIYGNGGFTAQTEPVINHGNQGATWYQTNVDATLPWIESNGTAYAIQDRVTMALSMIRGQQGSRLQNFFITFKPGETFENSEKPSDDPIFGAHRPAREGYGPGYVADREVSALSCAEVFKLCSTYRCLEPPTLKINVSISVRGLSVSKNDIWLDLEYPGMMSVWLNTLIDASYGYPQPNGIFLNRWPNQRQRWQDDVAARFILSMLRVRHASKYAAEQYFSDLYPRVRDSRILVPRLYHNSDYTNVNTWGFVATASGYLYIITASRWLILLSPLALPLRFLVWAASIALEKLKAVIIFGRFWIFVASNAITKFIQAANPRRRRQPQRSNALSMDTWRASQQNDEPDNPLRIAHHQDTRLIG